MSEDSQNLAATNAAEMQKKQEDQPEIPSWVPGDLPDNKKKEFVEAVKKAYEADNTQFDFDGRTYKITEKLVGNQDKLDVDGDGKIEADDLAALRAGDKVEESHMENETETPGQTQYPGSEMPALENNESNPTDKLTLDVPAMIRALEKSREDFKSDADIHNFVQDLLKKKDQDVTTSDLPGEPVKEELNSIEEGEPLIMRAKLVAMATGASNKAHQSKDPTDHDAAYRAHTKAAQAYGQEGRGTLKHKALADKHSEIAAKHKALAGEAVNEALDPKADAGTWISDFVNSTNPKFDGKSKEERKQMALAAWYAARRDAGINEGVLSENIAGDTRAATLSTSANNLSGIANGYDHTKDQTMEPGHAAHQSLKLHDAATRAHQQAADHYRVYAHHAGDSTLKHVAGIHHKFHSDMAQHHTLAGVGLSVGESVNEGAPADAKGGPEVMDVATKKMKDDADKNVKAEEAPYTNKADGSETVVPAEKPKPNPTPMNPSKAIKSVAQAYTEMVNEIDDSALLEEMDQIDESTGLPKKPANPHPKDHVKHYEFKANHATAVAKHYSGIANKSGKKSDHLRAAKAHHIANEAHADAGAAHADYLKGSRENGEEAADRRSNAHYEKAAAHEDKAHGYE